MVKICKHPRKSKSKKTSFCLGYKEDLEQAYSFYCARYKDIPYSEFLNLGLSEFYMKLNSIPENEPLFKIIKSRIIELGKIKDKNERKYWEDLKRVNKIPDIFKSKEELDLELQNKVKNGGFTNGKRLN